MRATTLRGSKQEQRVVPVPYTDVHSYFVLPARRKCHIRPLSWLQRPTRKGSLRGWLGAQLNGVHGT